MCMTRTLIFLHRWTVCHVLTIPVHSSYWFLLCDIGRTKRLRSTIVQYRLKLDDHCVPALQLFCADFRISVTNFSMLNGIVDGSLKPVGDEKRRLQIAQEMRDRGLQSVQSGDKSGIRILQQSLATVEALLRERQDGRVEVRNQSHVHEARVGVTF